MSGADVGAVVIAYKSWQTARPLIEALLMEPAVGLVVVVDNSEQACARPDWLPSAVVYLPRADNPGYMAAVNEAWAHMVGIPGLRHLLVLTHDVCLGPGVVERLRQDAPGALRGPLLRRRSSGEVWSAGGRISPWLHGSHLTAPPSKEPYAVDWLDGAVLMMDVELAHAVLPAFEGYWLYLEDMDLAACSRAAGAPVVLVPGAVAEQEPGGSLSPYLGARNRLLFARRHRPAWLRAAVLLRQLGQALVQLVRGSGECAPRVRGVWDGMRVRL